MELAARNDGKGSGRGEAPADEASRRTCDTHDRKEPSGFETRSSDSIRKGEVVDGYPVSSRSRPSHTSSLQIFLDQGNLQLSRIPALVPQDASLMDGHDGHVPNHVIYISLSGILITSIIFTSTINPLPTSFILASSRSDELFISYL